MLHWLRIYFLTWLGWNIVDLPYDHKPTIRKGKLIFEEEFDHLDRRIWHHLVTAWRGGNNEFQYYSDRPENSFVKNGILHIKPTLTADRFGEAFLYNGTFNLWDEGCNINYRNGCFVQAGKEIINPIQSARIRTINSFSFVYGTVQVRAKMPRGDWIWPAIWMMPTDSVYGGWPRSGEIDLVEIRGNDKYFCKGLHAGNKAMGSTLHFGTDSDHNIWNTTHWEKRLVGTDFAADFHIYEMQWQPEGFRFLVDGDLIGSFTPPNGGFWEVGNFSQSTGGPNIWQNGTRMAPFDQPFHFILNVAVGGNFFSDTCKNFPYPKPWKRNSAIQMRPFWESRDKWLPTWNRETGDNAMQIDYIRVYALN